MTADTGAFCFLARVESVICSNWWKERERERERRHEQPCEVHCKSCVSVACDINHKCEVPD